MLAMTTVTFRWEEGIREYCEDGYCDIYTKGGSECWERLLWQLGSCYGPVTIVKSRSWCLEKKVNPIPANPMNLRSQGSEVKVPT